MNGNMNFKVNIKVCRVCMKSEEGCSLLKDLDLQTKFQFTTRLSLQPGDCMPAIICTKCVMRLKIAYDFVQLAHSSEKSLRTFLAKVSDDFSEVTKASSSRTSSPSREDDDIVKLFDETSELKFLPEAPVKRNTKGNIVVKKSKAKIKSSDAKAEKSTSVKDTFKQELSGLLTDNVYYEEAHFLEESDNEDSDSKPKMPESTLEENDEEGICKSLAQNETKSAEEKQIDGYLQEYNVMVTDPEDNANESIAVQFIYDNSMENESKVTAVAEEIDLYEDAEEFLQEHDENLLSEVEIVGDRGVMNVELNSIETVKLLDTSTMDLKTSVLSYDESEPKAKHAKMSEKCDEPPSTKSSRKASSSCNAINPTVTRYFCMKCNRDFSTKTNLTRHKATHEGAKPYRCEKCGKSFSQNGSLKQHMYTHTGEKPFVCETCNRGFTQYKSLVFHMRRHTGEKPFPCEHCGLFFRQKDGLKNHILKHHMIYTSDGKRVTYTCIICKKLLATKYALQVHMKKHVNNQRTVNYNAASALGTDDPLMELISDDDFLNEKAFMTDELALNIEDVTSSTNIIDTMAANTAKACRVKKFQCRKCYKCFAIKRSLLRHLTTHDVLVSDLFQCKECQVAFDTNYALKRHRDREHKETDLNEKECEQCDTAFNNADELFDHNNSVHSNADCNEDHWCPECPDMIFKSEKNLLAHLSEHGDLLKKMDDD